MQIPVPLKVAILTVAATAFYTYVGQLVPQKEVHPPEVVEMSSDLSTADLVEIGEGITSGKGLCFTCHTVGKSGALRFPDLEGVAVRAGSRRPGYDELAYLAESLYHPDVFIVEGFSGGMPQISKPPIGLTDDEIRAVIAYLQTLGGQATITMDTVIPFSAAAPDGPSSAASEAVDDGSAAAEGEEVEEGAA
jgi:cytochrome c oxidase subunit 2